MKLRHNSTETIDIFTDEDESSGIRSQYRRIDGTWEQQTAVGLWEEVGDSKSEELEDQYYDLDL